jgi:hypothetical protein
MPESKSGAFTNLATPLRRSTAEKLQTKTIQNYPPKIGMNFFNEPSFSADVRANF